MCDATISGIGDARATTRLPSDPADRPDGTFTVHDLPAVRTADDGALGYAGLVDDLRLAAASLPGPP